MDTLLQLFSSVPTFVWIILGFLVGSGILMYPITLIVASNMVYNATLRRTSPEKWGRVPSFPEDPDSMKMDGLGMEWAEAHRDAMKEVHVVRDGVNLYGEYYDFADLLRDIDEIEGDYTLRFMTSHPKDASDKLIEVMFDTVGTKKLMGTYAKLKKITD